jgi:hypothetical protein
MEVRGWFDWAVVWCYRIPNDEEEESLSGLAARTTGFTRKKEGTISESEVGDIR